MIIKDKQKRGNFTSVTNALVNELCELPICLTIMVLMLSRTPDWHPRVQQIAKQMRLNQETIRHHLDILIAKGYVVREPIRDQQGRFCGYEYVVYEVPRPPKNSEPSAEKPSAEKPSAAEPSAAEPSAAEPSAAEPSAAEPSAAEPRHNNTNPNNIKFNNTTTTTTIRAALKDAKRIVGQSYQAGEEVAIKKACDRYGTDAVLNALRYAAAKPGVRRAVPYALSLLSRGVEINDRTPTWTAEDDPMRRPDAGELERMQRIWEKLRRDGISSGASGENTGEGVR